MEKKTVAVLFGGNSSEYEVSLESAASVIEHLDLEKYNLVLIGITQEGKWLKYNGSTEDIRKNRWQRHPSCIPTFIPPTREIKGLIELVNTEYRIIPIDVVFPVLHGKHGEDGTLQGLLELSGIPFVGCDMLSSAICMDKDIAHALVQMAGIETPLSKTVFKGDDVEKIIEDVEGFEFPLYVKPAKAGSSVGITKAYNKLELIEGVKQAFTHDNKVVIEQNIEGFEVGCAVLGHSNPIIGVIDEIELTGNFFDFNEKYSLNTSKIHLPARIDADTVKKVREIALKIYKSLGCKGFARVDMFLTNNGRVVFNEVNTIPGFTANSRYPKMLCASGISYPDILDQLIHLALGERGKEHNDLVIQKPKPASYDEIKLDQSAIHRGDLILVNHQNPIRTKEQWLDLMPVNRSGTPQLENHDMSLERKCMQQLLALLEACKAMDDIVVVSAYRSRAEQQELYENSLRENGAVFTSSYVARPDESEHQTGLAVDVGENIVNVDFICPSFPDQGVCQTFKRLAAEYGFIQRYKDGKEHITNIACEPWHFRYVGFPHSVIMEQQGLCLEEYIDFLKQYRFGREHLLFEQKNSVVEIYYVPVKGEFTAVPIINGGSYLISGNNKDGFVVTVFH